jgi:hypothetical protein
VADIDSSSPGPSRGRPLWISQKIFDVAADDIAPVYHDETARLSRRAPAPIRRQARAFRPANT